MKLEAALEQLLIPYMARVQVRPGNGLSKNMNGTLRSYGEIPLIIRQSVRHLATLECLLDFSGTAAVHYIKFHRILIDTNDDWFIEVPHLPWPQHRGPVIFIRKPRVPIHRFLAAWTIARRINLLSGRGALRLHSDVLAELRRLVRTPHNDPQKGGDPHMGDRAPPL